MPNDSFCIRYKFYTQLNLTTFETILQFNTPTTSVLSDIYVQHSRSINSIKLALELIMVVAVRVGDVHFKS